MAGQCSVKARRSRKQVRFLPRGLLHISIYIYISAGGPTVGYGSVKALRCSAYSRFDSCPADSRIRELEAVTKQILVEGQNHVPSMCRAVEPRVGVRAPRSRPASSHHEGACIGAWS